MSDEPTPDNTNSQPLNPLVEPDSSTAQPNPPVEPVIEKRDLIKEANEAAERMEKANTQREALLIREEALKVQETLGGKASAGTPQKKELSDEDYVAKVIANDYEEKKQS